MEELRLFFDALQSGNEDPVDVVRNALKRRLRTVSALQSDAMLSREECDRRLSELHKLSLLSDKIDGVDKELHLSTGRRDVERM